jgi:hypothetical protein
MTIQNKNLHRDKQQLSDGSRLFPGQIITTEDLVIFKSELIDQIKSIFKEMMDHGGKRWLRSRDVKEKLGISHGTLQNLRINGTLPYTKVGGVIFYDQGDITKMIESNRIDNTF